MVLRQEIVELQVGYLQPASLFTLPDKNSNRNRVNSFASGGHFKITVLAWQRN